MVSTRRSSRLQRSTPQPPGSFDRDSLIGQLDATPSKLQHAQDSNMAKAEDRIHSPRSSHNPFSSLLSKLTRTPKHKVSVLPTHAEMHPSQHHQSTTKPLDEARWLGFMPMTEPAKRAQPNIDSASAALAVSQATPTRVTQSARPRAFCTPPSELKLTSKRKASFDAELSPEAQRIMAETREEAAKIRAKMTAAKERQDAQDQHAEQQPVFGLTDALGARKIAKPRGRFSDAHSKTFSHMASIANHPSAFRADPARNTTTVPLKKFEEHSSKQLKRTHSKTDLGTPQKSSLPVKTSFTPIPPRDPALLSPAKRMKKLGDVDASASRPVPTEKTDSIPSSTNATRVKTGIPLPRFNPDTPTKASQARSQSAKTLRHTTSIPTLAKSPSLKALPKVAAAPSYEHVAENRPTTTTEQHTPNKLSKSPSIRSILRSGPKLLYSDDPAKLAAGTHIPIPKRQSLMPRAPATAPVKKHVNFTESTNERADLSEQMSSPSSASTAKQSMITTSAPDQKSVDYPSLDALSSTEHHGLASTSRPIAVPKSKLHRRQTMDAAHLTGTSEPGKFTFRAGTGPTYATQKAASTIRRVRNSDASALIAPVPSSNVITVSKKRKVEAIEEHPECSDKENEEVVGPSEEERPAKKAKSTAQANEIMKTVAHEKEAGTAAQKAAKTAVLKRTPALSGTPGAKKGGLTLARLNLLAMPKKKRT